MLVNSDKETITANTRVQECLQNARTAHKTIVRYIQVTSFHENCLLSRNSPQLVENEEVIGTLIETNERVVSALQMYDNVSHTNAIYLQFLDRSRNSFQRLSIPKIRQTEYRQP